MFYDKELKNLKGFVSVVDGRRRGSHDLWMNVSTRERSKRDAGCEAISLMNRSAASLSPRNRSSDGE